MNVTLKNVLSIVIGALTLSLMLGAESSEALEELKVYRGVLVLEGKIVAGDYDKLRNFLGTESNFEKINSGVFLASPGGNVAEAMRIGRLIRALNLSTEAPSGLAAGIPKFGESLIRPNHLVNRNDYLCTSACFFVYVAGIYRNLNWAGRLGVHQPTILEINGKAPSGDEAKKSAWFVRETIKNYLNDMDVPDKYVDLAFSVPPNEMRLITQNELDSDLQGFIPKLRGWVSARCDPRTNREKITPADLRTKSPSLEIAQIPEKEKIFSVPTNQTSEIVKCRMQVKTELTIDAWHKVFK